MVMLETAPAAVRPAGGVHPSFVDGDHFFQPTLAGDVPPTAEGFQVEVFGPVLPIAPLADGEEAVALADDSRYALAPDVRLGDLERASRVAGRVDAPTVRCGTSRVGDPHMPSRAGQESGGLHNRGLVDVVVTREEAVAIAHGEDLGPHWHLGDDGETDDDGETE